MILKIININKYCYKVLSYRLDNIFNQNYLIIDLEASGLNYKTEEITEIAVMPIVSGKKIFKRPWSRLIKIHKKIPKFIEKLTGIKNTDLKNASSLESILNELITKYKDYVWVAQCGFEFDFPFLNKSYRSLFGKSLPIQILDTKLMYQYLYPKTQSTISTNFLIKNYVTDSTRIKRHRAGSDVKLITEIFLKILSEYKQKNINKISINKPFIVKKFVPKSI